MDAPLVQHFLGKNHDVNNFKYVVIDKYFSQRYNRTDMNKNFILKETYWIYHQRPYALLGFNLALQFSMYI